MTSLTVLTLASNLHRTVPLNGDPFPLPPLPAPKHISQHGISDIMSDMLLTCLVVLT